MTLRRRLEKLEGATPPGSVSIDWNSIARGDINGFPAQSDDEIERAVERHPNAVSVRSEYDRVGVPQPTSLVNVDLVAEILRLAQVDDDALSASDAYQPISIRPAASLTLAPPAVAQK